MKSIQDALWKRVINSFSRFIFFAVGQFKYIFKENKLQMLIYILGSYSNIKILSKVVVQNVLSRF